ncbi:N-acetylneuraminate synthase family protein [Candidatus Pelagibacter sp.]|jgi:N,N'-diacetyllegionaminate synthase|nr:N-acetylneuraminate synthase family protein [Candidatus Pelagibacter sp.]
MKFIAELCQNHNGSYKNLKKMTIECAKSGADIIKLQYIMSNTVSFRPQFEEGLKKGKQIISIKRPYLEEVKRLKKLEIKNSDLKKFVKLCNSLNVEPAITCFTRQDVNIINKIGFKTVKIASYDCASFQLLRDVKNKFDKIIVSTGATFDNEIKKAASILKGKNFIFLHCVTIYPTPLESINLERINFLKKFTNKVGFSDHSLGFIKNRNLASMMAVYLGAEYIERHITILDKDKTKDGKVSIQPDDIRKIKIFSSLSKSKQLNFLKKKFEFNIKRLRGNKYRKLTREETLNRDYYKGRFISKIGSREIYNWEEVNLS